MDPHVRIPMKLTYFGHSALQIETGGARILFDPFISGNPSADGVVTLDDLVPDVIVVTHAHGDHWGDTPELAARTGALVVATHELAQVLIKRYHYANVQPLNTGGAWTFDWGRVKFTDARHSSSLPDGTYGGSPNGVLLYAEDKVVYNAGDTCPFAEMQWIGDDQMIDLAILPIGDCYTMCPEDALRAVRMLRPRQVLPVHYNTWPPIAIEDDRLRRWEDDVRAADAEPIVLQPGGSLVL